MKHFLILSALLFLFGCLDNDGTRVVVPGLEAKVIHLEGEVLVFDAPAILNQRIPEGAVIRTGGDGYVEIRIGTENIVSLRPDTDLIWSLHLDVPTLDIKAGTLSASLMSLPAQDNGDRLRVRTPTAVAGVRGTSFFLQVENPDNTYFCLCNGEAHLDSPEGGIGQTLEATEHNARWFVRRDGQVDSEKGELVYHDSPGMQELAGAIGQTIDWTTPHKME